jgi:hypothetical protein
MCLEELSFTVSLDIQVATAELLHMWQQYTCMQWQCRLSEIHKLYLPLTGNGNMAGTQIEKVEAMLNTITKMGLTW